MNPDLDQNLTSLRNALLSMSASTEQRVSQALDALFSHDADAALVVRTGDREIDVMEVDIEEECLRILALQHPLASDLRMVLAAVRINSDLERIADLASNIAKRVIYLKKGEHINYVPAMKEMADGARAMFADALRALAENDQHLAQEVRRADQEVDDRLKDVFAWAMSEFPDHTENARAIVDVLFVARAIERIADLSTNIAEDVIFTVGGAVVRHTPVD